MTRDRFWQLIATAQDESGTDIDAYADGLRTVLTPLEPDELFVFNEIFNRLLAEAYSWDLWGAAYLINGGCSDDGFVYFRAWLIMQGREIYENALRDPDSLAELCTDADEDIESEDVLYVAGELYEEKTGGELSDDTAGYAESHEPKGTRWNDAELQSRLPRLWAIHGSD